MKLKHTKSPNTTVKFVKLAPIIIAAFIFLLLVSIGFYSLIQSSIRDNRLE